MLTFVALRHAVRVVITSYHRNATLACGLHALEACSLLGYLFLVNFRRNLFSGCLTLVGHCSLAFGR